MLSKTQTQYLVVLTDKFLEHGFVIQEWDELKSLCLEGMDFDECWEQLNVNGCLTIKFKDAEQVCFKLTDRARLLVQDYKIMQQQVEISAKTMLQSDSMGRTIMVVPQEDNAEDENLSKQSQTDNKTKVRKNRGFWSGLIGGLLGGLLSGGGIFYLLSTLIG